MTKIVSPLRIFADGVTCSSLAHINAPRKKRKKKRKKTKRNKPKTSKK